MTKISKTERLLNLISFLLRSPRPVPFSEIAGYVVGYDDDAKLDSIEKRFDRDKAELRNLGIPIEYKDTGSPEQSGYIIPAKKFFLKKLELDGGDTVLLSLAARSGALALGSPMLQDSFRSALRKVTVDAPVVEGIPREPATMVEVISGNRRANEQLQLICSAVFGRRRIRFDYLGHNDAEPKGRRLEPYGMGLHEGEWYLVGFDLNREGVRMFKLSRIVGPVKLMGASDSGPEFDIPKDFHIRDHLDRDAWEFGSGEGTTVEIRMPKPMAEQLQRRHRADVKSTSEGTAVLSIRARTPLRLLDEILSWGPDVRVIAPPDLVKAAKDRIKDMLSHYGDVERGEVA
ncbi:MAG TPA: WYL domain-containing protein [Planctomycetes bacterium]|nr:WYL domain-containing protein [Planctomycetota bacterium]